MEISDPIIGGYDTLFGVQNPLKPIYYFKVKTQHEDAHFDVQRRYKDFELLFLYLRYFRSHDVLFFAAPEKSIY